MAIGLARCIRSENPAIRLVTLDLDKQHKLPASRTSEMVTNLYRAAFTSKIHSERSFPESEYLRRSGCIYMPRVVQDLDMDQCIRKVTQNLELE